MWEMMQLLNSLLDILKNCNIVQDTHDSWCWLGITGSPYSVKTAYCRLTCETAQNGSKLYKFLWDKAIPLKVGAFCWRSILDRVPTYSNLSIRGVQFDGRSQFCCFCKNNVESVTHLFISCNFSYFVWMSVYNWTGLDTTLIGNLGDLLLRQSGLITEMHSKKCWRMVWFAII